MTKDEFLSEFSLDYKELNDIYNMYQTYISTEDLNKHFDSNYYLIEESDNYLLDFILKKYDVIYEIVHKIFNVNKIEVNKNIDTIIDSIDFTEIFSLNMFSINVNIPILINNFTDVLIDLNLYKKININKYYVISVLNNILPYKITNYETY
nr:MAG TPA: hypothetical protein [Caudoviricetes sp.]